MKKATLVSLLVVIVVAVWFSQAQDQPVPITHQQYPSSPSAKVTFIELGSVRCVPCKAMQPIMAEVQQIFGDQLNIIFYDVWEADQRHYGQQYGLKLIPTQVFLDSTGTEVGRHQGFYPLEELVGFLESQGLKPAVD